MYFNSNDLKGMKIMALDGEIGSVEEFFFDDDKWTMRYLVVNTGGFLNRHDVLVSPISITNADFGKSEIRVNLTKAQVEDSPEIDTHMPISRKHEQLYNSYFSWPSYWQGGIEPWVMGPYGIPWGYYMNRATLEAEQAKLNSDQGMGEEEHLRSSRDLRSYSVQAKDDKFGHIESFIVDDHTWMIKFLEVDTINFFPSESVLMSPQWVQHINWRDKTISFPFSKQVIKQAPAYNGQLLTKTDEGQVIRYYEDHLHDLRKAG